MHFASWSLECTFKHDPREAEGKWRYRTPCVIYTWFTPVDLFSRSRVTINLRTQTYSQKPEIRLCVRRLGDYLLFYEKQFLVAVR